MGDAGTWHNWGRTVSARPVRRVRARDVAEVVAALAAATARGLPVKAVGSGHSFTATAASDGVMLDLSALDRLRAVDRSTGLVTVEAGITLRALSPRLWHHGLALENLGDIDRQTLAGAIATGTHGTGAGFGGLASRVRALEIVLADGLVLTCSPRDRPDLFAAALVGLGAFGVVTAVTLQCVPAFPMLAREEPVHLDDVLATVHERVRRHDHAEFFWFPHSDRVLALTKDRLPPGSELAPEPRWLALLHEEVVANGALAVATRLGAAVPRAVPAINRTGTRLLGRRSQVDRSYRVLAHARRVRFRESEFAVPAEAVVPILRELRAWFARPGHEVGFPLEVRFGAPEDAWLSPAHGRPTCWVSAQTSVHQEHEAYFARVQALVAEHGGRPHWGKLHGLDVAALAPLYPCFPEVLAVRDRVDPGRRFANAYTERVLGP